MAPLDQLLDLARERESLCALQIPLGFPNRRDLAAQARRTYLFHTKVRLRLEEGLAASIQYLVVHYVLSAVSEETHEETISIAVNASTLAPTPRLLPLFLGSASDQADVRLVPDRAAGTAPTRWKEAYRAAGREAARVAAGRIEALASAMDRRRGRDRDRLHAYFEGLAAEVRSRGNRRRSLDQEDVAQRLATVRRELERKVADLELRYALKATLRPVAAAVIRSPALQSTYHLQWKKETRELPVVWTPLTGDFEPMACDLCGSGGYEFTIGEDLRPHCHDCG
jgi:hypothetical protein